MTNEKLAHANDLSARITDLERIIENGEKHKCEWIQFTFGNGSSRENVCNDKDIIQSVRELIVRENKLKLAILKKELSDL